MQVSVRAAVVSTVFDKTLRARIGVSHDNGGGGDLAADPPGDEAHSPLIQGPVKGLLEVDTLGVTDGQVMNLMSTDCDRVANFCPRYGLRASWTAM